MIITFWAQITVESNLTSRISIQMIFYHSNLKMSSLFQILRLELLKILLDLSREVLSLRFGKKFRNLIQG